MVGLLAISYRTIQTIFTAKPKVVFSLQGIQDCIDSGHHSGYRRKDAANAGSNILWLGQAVGTMQVFSPAAVVYFVDKENTGQFDRQREAVTTYYIAFKPDVGRMCSVEQRV